MSIELTRWKNKCETAQHELRAEKQVSFEIMRFQRCISAAAGYGVFVSVYKCF